MNWIKCSDRMPPIGVRVLVSDGETVGFDALGRLLGDRFLLPSDTRTPDSLAFYNYCNVTHWMPLPEPPKDKP